MTYEAEVDEALVEAEREEVWADKMETKRQPRSSQAPLEEMVGVIRQT
jgi:hypothetical protein